MKAIDEIEYVYGFTNRADALRVMRTDMFSPENGDRPDVQVQEINCCCEKLLISLITVEQCRILRIKS